MALRRSDFRVYQEFFVEKIKQCFSHDPEIKLPGLILAVPPGGGKTATVLTALRDLLDGLVLDKVLIVAPLMVAQTVWPAEIDEWEHLPGLTWTLLRVEDDDPDFLAETSAVYAEALARYQAEFENDREVNLLIGMGKGEARAAARQSVGKSPGVRAEKDREAAAETIKLRMLHALADKNTEIHIINKEGLRWLWDHFGRGKHWPYQAMIIDDCREGRSGKKRSKGTVEKGSKAKAPLSRFGIMAAARKHMIATIQLTGTPTPKGLQNMWGLTYLIDLGQRLGLFKTRFLKRWFDIDTRTFRVEAKAYAFDEIMNKSKDIMFSLDPADLPQLPPYIIDPIRVKLPESVLKEYRRFKREMVSLDYNVEAVNRGVLHGKLLQFANGSMYGENGEDVWVHDLKIDALKLLVERLNGVPLLVFYTYQFDVDRIMGAFPKAVHLKPENAAKVVKDWNADKIELLLAHRASTGHGLNMQKGIGHFAEYGLTSDAELYLQAIKRIWRPGRKSTVINHVIMAEGTIDEDVFPSYLNPKIEEQDRILGAVQVSFGGDIADLLG